jgi:2-dehydro-3-deoxygalactonokinase
MPNDDLITSDSRDRAAIFVDLGTTNCRAWVVQNGQVLAKGHAAIGVRDTARERSPHRLHAELRALLESLTRQANANPGFVLAAGMIGSSLGLAEVPHVTAPAGLAELAAATRRHHCPDVTPLPIYIVPGVRTGVLAGDLNDACAADIMRGEETLCLGLVELGIVRGPATILNLGSHWKSIAIDSQNCIAGSVTSLSGELIHAAQTHTILSSAVPPDRPTMLDELWLDAGRREQLRNGLPRAMFCVRLLELAEKGTPQQRLAFLIGAFIAADDRLLGQGPSVAIVGTPALAGAWRHVLSESGVSTLVVSEVQAEQALLASLRKIAEARHQLV